MRDNGHSAASAELGIVALEHRAQRLNHQLVVLAHRQAGDGYAADNACAGDSQRK